MPGPTDNRAQLEADYRAIRRQYRIAAGAALTLLGGGAIFYHAVERLGWLNAFYFCTITLTTIGYGDITPKTDAGKFFTIFYVLVGVGTIAFFVNILIKHAVIRREWRRRRE